jgi:hypothetical protein
MSKNSLQQSIGSAENFSLDEVKSQYVLPRFKTFFSEKIASLYQPLIYRGDQIFDDDDDKGPATHPEGIYYRIVYDPLEGAYCIQYYGYWLMQNCTRFIGISNHKYDTKYNTLWNSQRWTE